MEYDKANETLRLNKRDKDNAYLIKKSSITNTNYSYHAPKMVYTGATVGGVTTGGWHEEKAYYSQEVSDSGKSKLKFKGKDGGTIKKIILTADLIASAKQQSDIKQFLKDDTLELQHLDCGG